MLSMVNMMINKFRININQIIANSDNTIDDIVNEAFIVIEENKNEIEKNQRVFINELKTRCLKFNKYGKRIESKKRWEEFNDRENSIDLVNNLDINEDLICIMNDVKQIIGKENYDFLIDYYSYGVEKTANKYKSTYGATKRKASYLVNKIRLNMEV